MYLFQGGGVRGPRDMRSVAADVESGSTPEAMTLNIILQYSGGINL